MKLRELRGLLDKMPDKFLDSPVGHTKVLGYYSSGMDVLEIL